MSTHCCLAMGGTVTYGTTNKRTTRFLCVCVIPNTYSFIYVCSFGLPLSNIKFSNVLTNQRQVSHTAIFFCLHSNHSSNHVNIIKPTIFVIYIFKFKHTFMLQLACTFHMQAFKFIVTVFTLTFHKNNCRVTGHFPDEKKKNLRSKKLKITPRYM